MKRSQQRHRPYAQICDNMGYGSCPSRTALFVYGQFRYEDMDEENEKRKYQPLATDELQGKGGQCFLSDSKVKPWEVSEKIILALLRYFPRKPCLTGSISRHCSCLSRYRSYRVLSGRRCPHSMQKFFSSGAGAPHTVHTRSFFIADGPNP